MRRGGGPSLRGPVVGALFAPDDWLNGSIASTATPSPSLSGADRQSARVDSAGDGLAARAATRPPRPATLPRGRGTARPRTARPMRTPPTCCRSGWMTDGSAMRCRCARAAPHRARRTRCWPSIVMVWEAPAAGGRSSSAPRSSSIGATASPALSPGTTAPLFWRRLEAVSGFAFRRDYLWMEQVDVEARQRPVGDPRAARQYGRRGRGDGGTVLTLDRPHRHA